MRHWVAVRSTVLALAITTASFAGPAPSKRWEQDDEAVTMAQARVLEDGGWRRARRKFAQPKLGAMVVELGSARTMLIDLGGDDGLRIGYSVLIETEAGYCVCAQIVCIGRCHAKCLLPKGVTVQVGSRVRTLPRPHAVNI